MDTSTNDSSLTCKIWGGPEPREGRGRGHGRGTKSPGRGFRPYSDLQVYERFMVRQGGEIQWSKWEAGAKVALRSAYGVHNQGTPRRRKSNPGT